MTDLKCFVTNVLQQFSLCGIIKVFWYEQTTHVEVQITSLLD